MDKNLHNVPADLAQCASDALRRLLEECHLYQSVTVDITEIAKIVIEAERESALRPYRTSPAEALAASSIADILEKPWIFTLEGIVPSATAPTARKSIPTQNWFYPPTVRIACKHCDGIKPPHNPGYLGIVSDTTCAFTSTSKPIQVFTLPYQCQNCKCTPLLFLVRREGLKLTLAGRSEFPIIIVPSYIPKPLSKFYKNSIISNQTGFILAAALYLRTVVEQQFRQQIPQKAFQSLSERPTGEKLGDLYADTLPKNFPSEFPSLKKAYSDLSAIVHGGNESEETKESFAKVLEAVDRHFEALALFTKILGAAKTA